MPESAVHDFQAPRATSPRSSSLFRLGTPVTPPLLLGGVAALAPRGLLQVAGLPALTAAQRVRLVAVLAK